MKHLFRAVFLAVFCLWSTVGVFAASATIDRIWLEHNVSQDGQTGLRIHLKFTVWDMQGQQGEAIAYFESPKGVGVKDLNRRYYTTDGNVSTSERFTPSYPGSEYSDFTLFIPNEELHLLPGSHTYYCQVFLFDAQGNDIAYSDYASTFTLRRDLTAATYHGGGSLSPLESYGPPMSRDSWMEASIAWGQANLNAYQALSSSSSAYESDSQYDEDSKSSSRRSTTPTYRDHIIYITNYTGEDIRQWCDQCQEWGLPHIHGRQRSN